MATLSELAVVIRAQTQDLQKGLADSEKSLSKLSKTAEVETKALDTRFRLMETTTKGYGTSLAGLSDKHTLLTEKLKLATTSTDALQKQYDILKDKPGVTADALAKMSIRVDEARIKEEQLRQELEKIETPLQRFGIAAEASGAKMTKLGGDLTKYVTAPVVAAGTAVVAFVSKMAGAADELQTMSMQTGVSVERLQELRYVASQTNTSFDAVTMAVATMTRNMVASDEEGSKMAIAFDRIGVQVRNADGSFRDMNDVFPETLKALADMPPGVERNNLLMEIFGTRAKELIPLLDSGSAGIEEFTAKAHELGLVNPDVNKSLADFNDRMEEVKQALAAAGAELAAKFVPILQDKLIPVVTGKIVPALMDLADWVGRLIDKFSSLSPGMQDFILKALGLTVALGPIVGIIGNVVKGAGLLSTAMGAAAIKLGLAGTAGTAAATGTAAAGTAAGIATPKVAGLAGAVNFLLGPWGLLIAGVSLFVYWATKLEDEAETSAQKISRLERESYTAAGTLDGDLSPALNEVADDMFGVAGATDVATNAINRQNDAWYYSRIAAQRTYDEARRSSADAAKAQEDAAARVAQAGNYAATNLKSAADTVQAKIQDTMSTINTQVEIAKSRFDLLAGSLDPVSDATEILNLKLSSQKEQLGLLDAKIQEISGSYEQMKALKGANSAEALKLEASLLREKLAYGSLTKSIADTNAELAKQASYAAGKPWEAEKRTATRSELNEWADRQAVEMTLSAQGKYIGGASEVMEALRDTVTNYEGNVRAIAKAKGVDMGIAEDMLDSKLLQDYRNGLIKLATGGIVTRPTMALIGESGPEAVVPLDRSSSGLVNITITGNTIASDYDVDRIGQRLVQRLRLAGVSI